MFDADDEVVKRTIGDRAAALLRARGATVTRSSVSGPAGVITRTLGPSAKRLLDLRGGLAGEGGGGGGEGDVPQWVLDLLPDGVDPSTVSHAIGLTPTDGQLAVSFTHADGQYYQRGAALTGATGTYTQCLVSFWHKVDPSEGRSVARSDGSGFFNISIAPQDDRAVVIDLYDAGFNGDTVIAPYEFGEEAEWVHVLVAYDYNTHANTRVAVNGELKVVGGGYFNAAPPTLAGEDNFKIGGLVGSIAHLYVAFGQWLDLSDPANIAKFYADGLPVDLGADGSAPTGTAPTIYTRGGRGDFSDNLGSGGDFSLTDPSESGNVVNAVAPGVELEGRAWERGTDEVAVGTLLGSDPNTENGWGETTYDTAALTVDGYATGSAAGPLAIVGSARDKLFSVGGGALVAKVFQKANHFNMSAGSYVFLAANGNDAVEVDGDATSRALEAFSWQGSLDLDIINIINNNMDVVDPVTNVVAIQLVALDLWTAANRSDVAHGVLDEVDRPPGNPLVALLIDGGNDAIKSIVIYDPFPSGVGLGAVSDTGVTNTAPHDMTPQWYSAGETNEFTEAEAAQGNTLAALSVTDDQGNPIAWSLVDDTSEVLGLIPQASVEVWVQTELGALSAGPYSFTIRATDPGGLYVEQEFEIEVVAP